MNSRVGPRRAAASAAWPAVSRGGVRYVKPGGEAVAEVTELLDIAPPRRG